MFKAAKICLGLLATVLVMLAVVAWAQSAEERIIHLPQDANKWYISVIGEPNSEQYKATLDAFETSKLQTVKSQCHFIKVTTDSDVYKDRYTKNQGAFKIKALPCVRIQAADGVVVYQACGKALPSTASGLYSEISLSVAKERILPRLRRHPDVEPDKPDAPVVPDPVEPVVPDHDGPPDFDLEGTDLALLAAVLGLAIGVGMGIYAKLRK